MGLIAKASLCAVAGFALLSVEATAQTPARSHFADGPSGYHVYKPPQFPYAEQRATQRPVTVQKPAQRAPSSNPYGTRPSR